MGVHANAAQRCAPVWGAFIAGAMVIGSVIAVDPAGWAPFGPVKWLAVSALGVAAAGSLLWHGNAPVHRASTSAWIAVLALLAVSAGLGDDVPTALLGQPDRHLGVATWLLFALLFAAGQQLVDTGSRRTVVRSAAVAAAALGMWSVWETFAGPPIAVVASSSRLMGPFGSAAYLGAASCLFVPIAAGELFDRGEPRAWRAVAAVGALAGMVGLIGSGARAAWIGALVAATVVLIRVRPPRRWIVIGAAAMAVLTVAFSPWLGSLMERPAGATSRWDEWAVAGRVITDHPVIGVGPEGYRIAVAEGVDRHYERTYGRDVVLPDRAHSGPLDVALAGGLPAAAIFVGMVVFVGRRAWQLSGDPSPAQVGIAAGLIAYAVQQLFLFPVAALDPVWWLFAGAIVAATRPADLGRSPGQLPWRLRWRLPWRLRWRLVPAAAAIVAVPIVLVAGMLDVGADRVAKQALDASGDGHSRRAVERAERATRLRPDDVRYRLVAAEVLARRGTLADTDRALAQVRRALDWSPLDPNVVDREASLLLDRAAITGERVDISAAVEAWQRLVERDPLRARWQLQYGRAAALSDDIETARQAWTVAADLSPRDSTATSLLGEIEQIG
jgi:O-antigen ligase